MSDKFFVGYIKRSALSLCFREPFEEISMFKPVLSEEGFSYLNRDFNPEPPYKDCALVEGVYLHPKHGLCFNSWFWKVPLL
jgi:hypothetical protein